MCLTHWATADGFAFRAWWTTSHANAWPLWPTPRFLGPGWRENSRDCHAPRQAAFNGQRQWHGADLDLHPALVPGAASGMALHRSRLAHPERIRRELQWAAAGWVPQRDVVHLDAAGPGGAGHLAAGLQQRQAALETRRAHPRRGRGPTGFGACPQPRCHPTNHQPSKQRTLRLRGYIQGSTSQVATECRNSVTRSRRSIE